MSLTYKRKAVHRMTTTEAAPTGGIAVTPDILRQKVDEIAQIDEQLEAASGSEAAGKRALENSLAKEYEGDWKENADKLVGLMKEIDSTEKLAGVYRGLVSALYDNFRKDIDEYLTAEVEANKENRPKVAPEQVTEWQESRKVLMDQYKALRGILEMFEQDISGIPEPKKRVGARGKRGKQVLRGFDFFIDGEPRTDKQNTLSNIANVVCAPLNWKTPELKNFLAEKGVDLENPPAEFEVMLPDPVNKLLSWKTRPVSLADEPDEEDEDDDEAEEDNGEE